MSKSWMDSSSLGGQKANYSLYSETTKAWNFLDLGVGGHLMWQSLTQLRGLAEPPTVTPTIADLNT